MFKVNLKTVGFRFRGFSLIELLVVVSIISLLSTIVISSLDIQRQRARDAVRKSDLRQIHNALELYYVATGGYPNSLPDLADLPDITFIQRDPLTDFDYQYNITCGVDCFVLKAVLEAPKTNGFCWYDDTSGNREDSC